MSHLKRRKHFDFLIRFFFCNLLFGNRLMKKTLIFENRDLTTALHVYYQLSIPFITEIVKPSSLVYLVNLRTTKLYIVADRSI